MRLRATSLVLAGVLLASGGALAVAQTADPGSTAEAAATTETTAEPLSEPSSSTGDDEARTRTPPGWAKRDAAKDHAQDKTQDKAQAKAQAEAEERAEDDGGGSGPDSHGAGRGNGRGPDATGPAGYGLCQAWANQEDPAAKAEHVPPFRNLAVAAGGVDEVDAYCAALPEREPDAADDDDDD